MTLWQDDHAAFERPRKRSRPRTKDRPDYPGFPDALVASIDRGRYRCLLDDGTAITATRARILGRRGVIVGDRVKLDGDVSGAAGTLTRIVEASERRVWLYRSAGDVDILERLIVANANQLMTVTAPADPESWTGMIDRILVAAYDTRISSILCLTKADLAPPEDLRIACAPLDTSMIATRPGDDLSPVRELLEQRTTVLVGYSGVGRSTLVNMLVPGTDRATGAVSDVASKGRRTSISAVVIALPGGSWIIDIPGVRSSGISYVHTDALIGAFPNLEKFVADYPHGCRHDSSTPEYALDEAVRSGRLGAERSLFFRRMERAFVRSRRSRLP